MIDPIVTGTGEPTPGVAASWWFPAAVLAFMLLVLVPAAAWLGAYVATRLESNRRSAEP